MDKFTRGAGGRNDARRQNPAGKNRTYPLPFTSAKVRYHIPEAGVSSCKIESLALVKARVNMGFGGNSAYFGKRNDPAFGSLKQAMKEPTYFRNAIIVFLRKAFQPKIKSEALLIKKR